MQTFPFANKSASEILDEFAIDPKRGLSSGRARKLLEQFGPNRITSETVNWWNILIRQFKSPFIYLLIGASILALILGEIIDSLMIFSFLLINAGLGFYQEYSSEKTIRLLRQYNVSTAKVLRDGKVAAINSEVIVKGDIIIMETGDKLPADVRFIETTNLAIDESILTGESFPASKNSDTQEQPITNYYQALNLGFSGTNVLNGWTKAVVIATGRETAIGRLAHLTASTDQASNFEKGISKFSNFILKLIGVTLVFVFLGNLLIKGRSANITELMLFSIALAISVIPEALPVVTTFSLARGARYLAKQKVIVKRLSAIEDLGGIEILCTDKTGTLTENKLKVADIYSTDPAEALLCANLAANEVEKKKIEPFDLALWNKLPRQEKNLLEKYSPIAEMPFKPELKRNCVLVKKGTRLELITRGAPEVILKLCANLSPAEIEKIEKWASQEGKKGRRVLAAARKQFETPEKNSSELKLETITSGFAWLGAFSFIDPIKRTAFEAVKQASVLGVKIRILTGDGSEVAGVVAKQIGLITDDAEVITGDKFESLPRAEQAAALEKYSVFARVSPEQKFFIIQALQEKNEVGFLGEGINDAPALKAAGVSLVVDGAADIARDAADIILLQKNLNVILDGIRHGREVFANTTKYIKSTLASNFGNYFAIAIASLIIDYLPMLPIQILLLNLLSDFPMIAVSTDSVENKELLKPKSYDVKDIILLTIVLGIVSTVFDFIFFGIFYRISPAVLQTNWFIGSILTEIVLIFSIRSRGLFFRTSRPSGSLLWLTIVAIATTIILPLTAFGQKIFSFIRPSFGQIALIISIVAVYFICTEAVKLIFSKINYRSRSC